jgi:hypothetical protein
LLVLAGCSRCNDGEQCSGSNCVTNLDSSSSASSDGDDESTSASASTASEDESDSEGAGSSTGVDDGQCHGTDECAASEFCVAPYADNVRGAFACVSECVGPMDESVWCYDDAACCDATAACSIRGYCETDAGASSESSSEGGSSGSSSDSGSTG